MQEKGNSFALESEVIASLRETIGQAGGTHDEIAGEADTFLERIRVRGGLFVKRTGDYYAFLHRTFQEYFAARYVLNKIELQPITWIPKFVNMARRSDALWREPFLLAVAYQSKANKKLANDILCELLAASPGAGQEEQEQDVLLAAECVVEAKPLSIEATLETRIVNQLLQVYEQAQRNQRFEICDRVEEIMRRWLLSLPREAYRPPLVAALYAAIADTASVTRQRATLTMLTMIAQQLDNAPSLVFSRLIPPLLALAGLPAIGEHQSAPDVPAVSDFNVADLALTLLSFMGKRGPAGLLLAEVRQYFKDHPAHLRLLARYSLECDTLLTLAVVPLAEENYRRYTAAIEQWIKLRDSHKAGGVTEQEIDTCLGIHQALLDCAEEVSYPTATHQLNMLQASAAHPGQPWQETWRSYLLDQLRSRQYIAYQEIILLWVSLFPEEKAQTLLTSLLLYHYNSDGSAVQRYAQRFLGTLSTDIRDIRDLRDLRDIRGLLLVKEVADKAIKLLSYAGGTPVDMIDLLIILLGRVLQIQEAGESVNDVEREIQEIVQTIQPIFTSTHDEKSGIVLDILGYLPARSANEIEYVLQLANGATDARIQTACASALRYAESETSEARAALEVGRQSKVEVVREVVEERLKQRR